MHSCFWRMTVTPQPKEAGSHAAPYRMKPLVIVQQRADAATKGLPPFHTTR